MDSCKQLHTLYVIFLLKAMSGFSAKSYFSETNLVAIAGKDSRILLSCPLSIYIPVKWFKDGTVIRKARKYILSGGNLIVSNVELQDEGTYICQSKFHGDYVYRAMFNVVVNRLPRIISRKQRHFGEKGSTVIISCKANGKPKPDVFWINEDGYSPISPPNITQTTATSLRIKDIRETDSVVFICIAQNIHGRARAKFVINTIKSR